MRVLGVNVNVGDTVEITPVDKCPNMGGEIKVCGFDANGLLYDVSEYSDGYVKPFWAMKSIKVIKRGEKR